MPQETLSPGKCLRIELLLLVNWFSLIFFAGLGSFLDLGNLSHIALRFWLFANIPIALCYGMFVLKFQPPLGKRLFLRTESRKHKTIIQELPQS